MSWSEDDLLAESLELWRQTPGDLPPGGREYSIAEQSFREEQMDRFLQRVEAELRGIPRNRLDRDRVRDNITAAFAEFAKNALGLEDRHLNTLLHDGFSAIGTDLGRRARRFDPDVLTEDILQACRNTWTACGLQALMGGGMTVTPSIFAYSMLYPYTDNYMDDPSVGRDAKLGFSARFRDRLAGEEVAAANHREKLIWDLVGVIESQYSRGEHPAVFRGLLSIHHAQEQSLRLLRAGVAPAETLEISFAKGGASVLADALLVRGSVTGEEARFAYRWGVLLQLADDLQDVERDRDRGLMTVFSREAGVNALDELTSRTIQIVASTMTLMKAIAVPGSRTLQELIASSGKSVLVRSAGQAAAFHTPAFIARLERQSPFRFAFLRERRAALARKSTILGKMFEAFLAASEDEPVFPLLPGTLMPRG